MAQQSLSIVLLEQESQKMPRLEEDLLYPKVGRSVGMVHIQHCSGHVNHFTEAAGDKNSTRPLVITSEI